MSRPGFIDQTHLREWANTLSARSEFPRLVRRLVLETANGAVRTGVPAGEGVSVGDWDGIVKALQPSAFVPAGLSLWEFSVEKSVGRKADSDYEKRLATPDGSPPNEAIYVAASLRRWKDRGTWTKTRSAEGRWRTVIAYGVDDIETWLESAPVTHAWISDLLGLNPHGLQAAETWWRVWSSATNPALPADLILAGRGSATSALEDRLAGSPQLTSISASRDDVLAFVAAVGVRTDGAGQGEMLARTAFVDDVATWRSVIARRDPLILVPTSPAVVQEAQAGSAHHVIVPVPGAATADIELPPVDPGEAATALASAGLDEQRSEAAGRLARRSIVALRRHLATKPELHSPGWAQTPDRVIRGTLLAGAWNAGATGDREVLADLCGASVEQIRDQLTDLIAEDDSFVTALDRSWALVSPYDAWLQLRRAVRDEDLERLEQAVLRVMLESDPALELPAGERWKAGMLEQARQHSHELRHGLATTLALLSSQAESTQLATGPTGAVWASRIVRQVLAAANDDQTGRIWASLASALPLLAEAAPDDFLDAVRTGVAGDPILRALFDEDSNGWGSSSPHTWLLWALERLAWPVAYFSQAIDLLARLAEIDPNGPLRNRPANSLAEIYCPWHPETAAPVARRLEVLDARRERHGSVAWRLMLSLLPEAHAIHHHTAAPEFREWKVVTTPVKTVEYFDFVRAVLERLVTDAGSACPRWQDLVNKADDLPPSSRSLLRSELSRRIADGTLDDDGRTDLWAAIRAMIAKHRDYPDTDWALPADELHEFEQLQDQLVPNAPLTAAAWLFASDYPSLGIGRDQEYERYRAEIERQRAAAVDRVLTSDGLDGVRALTARAAVPWAVGVAVADVAGEQFADELALLFEGDDPNELNLASSYVARRFRSEGWPLVESLLSQDGRTPKQKARILFATSDYPAAWDIADREGPEVAREFWTVFLPYGLGARFPHVLHAAGKMLDVGRPVPALQLLDLYVRDEGPDMEARALLVADALEALLAPDPDSAEMRRLTQSDFADLFGFMEQHREAITPDRLGRLEWAYLPALGWDPRADTLHQLLAEAPDFFVEVVSAVFRQHSAKDTDEASPEKQRVASNAYRLLSSWSTVPGTREGEPLDGDALRAWITEALRLLGEADRREVGEIQIGHMLAAAPADEDGFWPCRPVRDLIEDLKNKRIERGIRTQLYNSRGVTSRSPDEGGNQERRLVARYRGQAEQLAVRWPQTAAILRDLAESYESDARRFDQDAERVRRGFDR